MKQLNFWQHENKILFLFSANHKSKLLFDWFCNGFDGFGACGFSGNLLNN